MVGKDNVEFMLEKLTEFSYEKLNNNRNIRKKVGHQCDRLSTRNGREG